MKLNRLSATCLLLVILDLAFRPDATAQDNQNGPDAQNILVLKSNGRIAVQADGAGIDTIEVRVRRAEPRSTVVIIPAGTYFVSGDSASQNMVATEDRTIALNDDNWHTVRLPAACANRAKNVPSNLVSFIVGRPPSWVDLPKLSPVLARTQSSFAVRQAAVWIVTDNATYADLGVLKSNTADSSLRLINEPEAAQALRICDEAGIDLSRKAILGNISTLATALPEGADKVWLAQWWQGFLAALELKKKDVEKVLALVQANETNRAARIAVGAIRIGSLKYEEFQQQRAELKALQVVQDADLVTALQLFERAGVDLNILPMWKDRATLSDKLPEGDLKKWLAEHE